MSSVGELLDQANLRARDLLYEAGDRDGRDLVRTWGEVVESAGELWRAIPTLAGQDAGASTIDQLELHARSLHREVRGGSTRLDPDLQEIAGLLARAAEAITTSGVHRLPTEAHLRDAFATRVSLMHTLHVAAHGVVLGLHRSERLEAQLPEAAPRPSTPAVTLRQRMDIVEELALCYHRGAYPEALTETHRDWIDPDRLGVTVSAWDVHAHRALASAPTAAGLAHVAETQLATTLHAIALWRVAAEQGSIDPREHRTVVQPALEDMVERWALNRSAWQDLMHPHQVAPTELRRAGTDLRVAFGRLARDRVGPVLPEVLATRVDMAEVLQGLIRFHTTAAGAAAAVQAVVEHGQIQVGAVEAQALVSRLQDSGRIVDTEDSPISPHSLYLKRAVPLPQGLRGPLAVLAEQTAAVGRSVVQGTVDAAGRPASLPRPDAGVIRVGPRSDPGRLRMVREQLGHGSVGPHSEPAAGVRRGLV